MSSWVPVLNAPAVSFASSDTRTSYTRSSAARARVCAVSGMTMRRDCNSACRRDTSSGFADANDHVWEVQMSYRRDGGRWVLAGVEVRCPHDPPHNLTRRILGSLPLVDLQPFAMVEVGEAIVADDGTWTGAPTERAQGRTGRPKVYDTDHYREVANVYKLAIYDKRNPRAAVLKAFDDIKSERTAARHIAEARRIGFLGPTTPCKAGEQE